MALQVAGRYLYKREHLWDDLENLHRAQPLNGKGEVGWFVVNPEDELRFSCPGRETDIFNCGHCLARKEIGSGETNLGFRV